MVLIPSSGGGPTVKGTLAEITLRPQKPPKGTKWSNPTTGETEEWDGTQWILLTRFSQILPGFGDGSDSDVTISGSTTPLRAWKR